MSTTDNTNARSQSLYGSIPMGVRAAGWAGVSALAGGELAPAVATMLARLLLADKPEVLKQLHVNGRITTLGRVLGGALGYYLGGGRNIPLTQGWGPFLKAGVKGDAFHYSPEKVRESSTNFNRKLNNARFTSNISKEAFDAFKRYDSDTIPISRSMDLVASDRYMDPFEKNKTNMLIFGAENKDSGMTSSRKLATSALKAGAGFATAHTFGKAFGSILSLPPPLTQRLSMIGGIAAAVHNSGVLNELNF